MHGSETDMCAGWPRHIKAVKASHIWVALVVDEGRERVYGAAPQHSLAFLLLCLPRPLQRSLNGCFNVCKVL